MLEVIHCENKQNKSKLSTTLKSFKILCTMRQTSSARGHMSFTGAKRTILCETRQRPSKSEPGDARQHPTLPDLARTECKEEDRTSIQFLRYCRRECPRLELFLQGRNLANRSAHTRRCGQRRVERGRMWISLLACSWLGSGCLFHS